MIEYTKDRPLRCFFAFEGYNSQGLALKRLKQTFPDFNWMCVGRSEIDAYAIKAADALFPDAKEANFGDISTIDWTKVPDSDLFTMSSPCQDFSCAGKQRGGEEGSGTRSSLLWECRKAIEIKRPKYIIFENVPALVSQKFIKGFNKWQLELEGYGYTNFVKVLNATDFGVPQSRNRVFMVSILNCDKPYYFPKPFPLERRLKDVLEEDVDERYFICEKRLAGYRKHNERHKSKGTGFLFSPKTGNDISSTIRANGALAPTDNHIIATPRLHQVASLYDNNAQAGRIYDAEGISPCVKTYTGGNSEPKILTQRRTEKGRALRKVGIDTFANKEFVAREDGVSNTITTVQKDNLLYAPNKIILSHGTWDGWQDQRVIDTLGISSTLDTNCAKRPQISTDSSIRRLTPREVFRLMDVDDEDIDKIFSTGISNSQLFKMAGNSIVTNCLYHIFRKLFVEQQSEDGQLSLF